MVMDSNEEDCDCCEDDQNTINIKNCDCNDCDFSQSFFIQNESNIKQHKINTAYKEEYNLYLSLSLKNMYKPPIKS